MGKTAGGTVGYKEETEGKERNLHANEIVPWKTVIMVTYNNDINNQMDNMSVSNIYNNIITLK